MFVLSLIAFVIALVFLHLSANITDEIDHLISILIILFFLGLSLIFAPLLLKLLILTVLLLSLQPKLVIKDSATKSSISQK
ncbi:MAG: hypothetical protein C4323_24030 [Mastigocladus sp. ERB_26_2]